MFKLKKIVPALVVTASLLLSSQSAFAVSGLADTRSEALNVYPNTDYTWTLDTAADEDWFYWTNSTSSTQYLSGSLLSPAGKNYNLQLVLVTAGGWEYVLNTNDNGPGQHDGFNSTLQPGDKIYFKIRPSGFDYDKSNPYKFNFKVS
ncbi:hypothetical protein PC41400_27185 [Paenibacillus chitinolyticus]|uniref:Uncharacterized protein n=1 Tax=Paenibacillus chitinolyticus TaxID=79263 RepID=A0A410X3G5_9BACL|nr:hypothetical protein [Paenibacillus chitinolyticus]MBV6717316.1 hypothetical protein [Paenibacillus chitinolyticus]MCY9592981.1 hypothetical protein [Paenibacillus chitinolyticus]MCY9598949.1 hypothetical protein [Paenibacillus chitinolyticus]QAV21160.1 hypothetical protein PC41400_27185 [Paenibacillus chitinolyticus]